MYSDERANVGELDLFAVDTLLFQALGEFLSHFAGFLSAVADTDKLIVWSDILGVIVGPFA